MEADGHVPGASPLRRKRVGGVLLLLVPGMDASEWLGGYLSGSTVCDVVSPAELWERQCAELGLASTALGSKPDRSGASASSMRPNVRWVGGVRQPAYAASRTLRHAGVLSAGDMTLEAVVTKSMWLSGPGQAGGRAFRERLLRTNVAGRAHVYRPAPRANAERVPFESLCCLSKAYHL